MPRLGTKARIATDLRKAGRQRSIEARATQLHQALRQPQLRQPAEVEQARGIHALTLLASLNAECASVEKLGDTMSAAFAQHPDYDIITSFPGLSDRTGARILAEIGDDRRRFSDARALKA